MAMDTLDIARVLVGFNTVSEHSNLALIHWIRDYLGGLGVASRLSYNADRTKANLFATLGAGKPDGLILSGHTDTVPWTGQPWTVDPLGALVRDDRLYGRGSADMKGFIAACLAHAPRFLQSDAPHAIHLAFSYDEEVGCFGVRELIADMRGAGIRPVGCVVGEPTGMVPAIAHKGVYRWRCCVRGKPGHSSLTPQLVNAVDYAARMAVKIQGMAERWEREETRYPGFDVPWSTACVAQFHGGTADNIVPQDAELRYEFRNLPTADVAAMQAEVERHAAELTQRMRAVAPETGIRFETICEDPAFLTTPGAPLTRLAQAWASEERTTLVAFGTEAGLFTGAGIPCIVCGPGHIAQAHQPDEFVELEQLARCDAFLQALGQARALPGLS